METESLRILRERESEISAELDRLRPQVKALELELNQVRNGLRAMEGVIPIKGDVSSRNAVIHHARAANPEVQHLTIKQLVVKALGEHLTGGATALELLDFFARKWGRVGIMRTSLSPQLSRLKDDGRIRLEGKVWKLNQGDFDPFDFEQMLETGSPNENREAEASLDTDEAATSSSEGQEFDL